MRTYSDFLSEKKFADVEAGFLCTNDGALESLFEFQKPIVQWALKRGRAAIFADTGLGKTAMQLAWSQAVHQHSGNRVLIVAPYGVAVQTVSEGEKFGVPVRYVQEFNKDTGIYVTNYEHIEKFEWAFENNYFDGIVLDESSILKHQTSKTRAKILKLTKSIPFRLSCTATPSPNDHMELGSQAEFLNIMSAAEMLAMFFTHDSGETSKWRLKGHGASRFWEWLSTWAVCIRRPSDLGFSDAGYDLAPLEIREFVVETGKRLSGNLFIEPARSLPERIEARRITVEERCREAKRLFDLNAEANLSQGRDKLLIWCNLNAEQDLLADLFGDLAVSIEGSTKPDKKIALEKQWREGNVPVLITKPKCFGFGMNWQHCADMSFVGLNDSFEQLYQSIRRCHRFGQTKQVRVNLISADIEGETLKNLREKEAKHEHMSKMMVEYMRDFTKREVLKTANEKLAYLANQELKMPKWLRKQDEVH